MKLASALVLCAALFGACSYAQQAQPAGRRAGAAFVAGTAANFSYSAVPAADDVQLERGRALYISATYKCSVCHGDKGEGADGPDLTGSLLTEEQIARFLQKPSAVATSRGMPALPANSPEIKPLAAYVFSLQAP